jgi:rubredoxin
MLQPRKVCGLGRTEDVDNPFEGVDLHVTCPKCGAETKLMRLEKFPDFIGEIHVYECSSCHHEDEVIGSVKTPIASV